MEDCVKTFRKDTLKQSRKSLIYQSIYMSKQQEHHNGIGFPDIRRGQYEGIAEKVTSPEWEPTLDSRLKPKMG